MKGDTVNFHIGNVQIYNPKRIRLFNNPTKFCNEIFDKEKKDDIFYCNGAVTFGVVDTEYAKQEALQILENTLDLIASYFISYKIPLTINKFKYCIIDMSGNFAGVGSTNDSEVLSYEKSLDIDNTRYGDLINSKLMLNGETLEIDRKILESMHWNRRAIESNETNEKILWHWVALENLFENKHSSGKTPDVIFEVSVKLLAEKYMKSFAWKHFNKLREITHEGADFGHYRQKIILPYKLMREIGLNNDVGEKIYLNNFIKNINNLKPYLIENTLVHEQFEYLHKVFTDKKQCLGLIKRFEEIFFEKLVYVYRARNKIVHNAFSGSSPIVDDYVEFIALVSQISINTFKKIRADLSLESNGDIIEHIKYKYSEFKQELDEKGAEILLGG